MCSHDRDEITRDLKSKVPLTAKSRLEKDRISAPKLKTLTEYTRTDLIQIFR